MNTIILNKNIVNRLSEIELEHNVKILYAVESGSRAWGFESIDSDYDIRFIYKNQLKWYLSVLPQRDVIEYPIIDEYDYSGWDLKKTLFLLNKSNPVLFEWFKSPIVYKSDHYAYEVLKTTANEYFSPVVSIQHYLNMAKNNYRQYMNNNKVKIKKYLYILRPLLACKWIEKYNQSPTIIFEELLSDANLNRKLHSKILKLLKRKKSGIELGLEEKIPEINDFIDNCIKNFNKKTRDCYFKKPNSDYLNSIFQNLLEI